MQLKNIPNPLQVIKYHSLAAKSDILPQELKISDIADDGTIMGVPHKDFPVEGLQFHPESIKMKPHGMKILKNFLELSQSSWAKHKKRVEQDNP